VKRFLNNGRFVKFFVFSRHEFPFSCVEVIALAEGAPGDDDVGEGALLFVALVGDVALVEEALSLVAGGCLVMEL